MKQDEKEKQKNENSKHVRFLIAFSVVYILIKYGYPLLKQLIF